MELKVKQGIGIWSIALLLAACQSPSPRQEVSAEQETELAGQTAIDDQPQQPVPSQVVPSDVSRDLIPKINLNAYHVPLIEDDKRFDISVNHIPADQFFLSLVDGTEYNMVVHPEVSGLVSLNLKNVTIPEVLEAARDVYGFEFIRTAYGFQVLPSRLQAHIYQINYLNVDRSGSSSTQVSSGSLIRGGSGDSRGIGDNGTTDGEYGGVSTLLGSSIKTSQPETNFWQELQSSVQAIVGSGEGRSVVVNPQSGIVVVRALPNELREVEIFLQATQLIVQRQVILEAKILEVILNDGAQTGINWSGLLTPGSDSITVSNVGGGTILVNESEVSGLAGNRGNLDPANFSAIDGAMAGAFGGVFTLALELGDFTSFIELLETQGRVQVLSSPRVATVNNQKAVIKVGTDEFFVTDVTNTTITGTATTTTPSVTLTPFFSGIALDVTPQISQRGEVILHVHPSISEVVDQQKTVTIGTVTQELPLALSTVRESDSIVRARSGQVIVIGGLMQDISDSQVATTPILGSIPGLGELFRHRRKSIVKSELVILLKPIVVSSEAQWHDELQTTRDSFQPLQGSVDEPNMKQFLDDLF